MTSSDLKTVDTSSPPAPTSQPISYHSPATTAALSHASAPNGVTRQLGTFLDHQNTSVFWSWWQQAFFLGTFPQSFRWVNNAVDHHATRDFPPPSQPSETAGRRWRVPLRCTQLPTHPTPRPMPIPAAPLEHDTALCWSFPCVALSSRWRCHSQSLHFRATAWITGHLRRRRELQDSIETIRNVWNERKRREGPCTWFIEVNRRFSSFKSVCVKPNPCRKASDSNSWCQNRNYFYILQNRANICHRKRMIIICFEYIIERVAKKIHYHAIMTVKLKFIISKQLQKRDYFVQMITMRIMSRITFSNILGNFCLDFCTFTIPENESESSESPMDCTNHLYCVRFICISIYYFKGSCKGSCS